MVLTFVSKIIALIFLNVNDFAEKIATYLKRLCEFFEVSADFFLGLENMSGTKLYPTPTIEEIPPISKEAQTLLQVFNQLPYVSKMRVQAYAEAALDIYTEENNKKKNG